MDRRFEASLRRFTEAWEQAKEDAWWKQRRQQKKGN